MAVEDMFGNLRVVSYCGDAGRQVTSIAHDAQDAVHCIEVENWGTVPYDLEIESLLPQHPSLLEFAAGPHSWIYRARSLAQDDLQRQDHALLGLGVTGSERIHVVRVTWKKAGKRKWKLAAGSYPLSLAIDVV